MARKIIKNKQIQKAKKAKIKISILTLWKILIKVIKLKKIKIKKWR